VHTKEKPFPCSVKNCSRVKDRGFSQRDHLTEHLRSYHAIPIPKRKPRQSVHRRDFLEIFQHLLPSAFRPTTTGPGPPSGNSPYSTLSPSARLDHLPTSTESFLATNQDGSQTPGYNVQTTLPVYGANASQGDTILADSLSGEAIDERLVYHYGHRHSPRPAASYQSIQSWSGTTVEHKC
jgi:hypothetical protein